MIIANPMYDVVFKRLMENDRAAKFFLSTMLGQKVESLEMQPREFTYEVDQKPISVRLFRVDFMAIVKTDEGETKKILIEVQKAMKQIDLMRFRNYLAEQYKKQEIIHHKKTTLPIITIYILGFPLPEIETACVHVERQYRDMINHAILDKKNDFIECLTHDSYVVQVLRITDRYRTRLDKLLSVFEQKNFIGDSEIIKEYEHETDDEGVKIIADILHHAGTDPETRKKIENEREANRTINAMIEAEKQEYLEKIEEKDKALTDSKKALSEKDKALTDSKKALSEKEKIITERDKLLEEQRKLIEKLLGEQKDNKDQ